MHKANPLSHWCDDLLRVLVLIAFVFFCVCLYACMCVVESECLRLCVLICVWFVRLARGERRQSPVIGEMERTHIPLISRSCKRSSRVKFYQTFVIAICQWQNFIVCHFLSTFFCDCHLSFANDHLVYILTDCLWLLFVICKRPSCVKLYQTFFLSDYFCHFVLYFIQFFLITCCHLAKIRSDWHSNHQRRHCKILGGDISMMCYHHFDFWGSGHLSIMLKCRIENHSLVVSHLPSDN